MFKAYFELLYLLWVVDILRTVKVHHCLSLVTIGCPQQPLIQWVIIGNLMFKAYFELLYLLWVVDISELKHHCLSLVTIGCPQQPLNLVGDNREFDGLRHILNCYTYYGWLIVSEHQRSITCLSLVTIGCPQQPLIQWVIIGNLMFKAYFELLYLLWVVDILRTVKVHHCLSLVTIGCPQQPLIQWVIIGNLMFKAYFELLYLLWVVDILRRRCITVCPWLPLVAPSNH